MDGKGEDGWEEKKNKKRAKGGGRKIGFSVRKENELHSLRKLFLTIGKTISTPSQTKQRMIRRNGKLSCMKKQFAPSKDSL